MLIWDKILNLPFWIKIMVWLFINPHHWGSSDLSVSVLARISFFNLSAIEIPNMPVMLCWMLFHWNNVILLRLQIFFSFHTIFDIGTFGDATFFNSLQKSHKSLFVKNFIWHILQTKNLTKKLILCLVIFTLLCYYIHL